MKHLHQHTTDRYYNKMKKTTTMPLRLILVTTNLYQLALYGVPTAQGPRCRNVDSTLCQSLEMFSVGAARGTKPPAAFHSELRLPAWLSWRTGCCLVGSLPGSRSMVRR